MRLVVEPDTQDRRRGHRSERCRHICGPVGGCPFGEGVASQLGDVAIIDGLFVNGSAKLVGWFSGIARKVQTGLLYHYAFAMIIGVLALMTFFVIF